MSPHPATAWSCREGATGSMPWKILQGLHETTKCVRWQCTKRRNDPPQNCRPPFPLQEAALACPLLPGWGNSPVAVVCSSSHRIFVFQVCQLAHSLGKSVSVQCTAACPSYRLLAGKVRCPARRESSHSSLGAFGSLLCGTVLPLLLSFLKTSLQPLWCERG